MDVVNGHAPGLPGRRQIGMTPISPSRPLYGTFLRCECGVMFRSNEAPSKGGRRDVTEQHREHVARLSEGEQHA